MENPIFSTFAHDKQTDKLFLFAAVNRRDCGKSFCSRMNFPFHRIFIDEKLLFGVVMRCSLHRKKLDFLTRRLSLLIIMRIFAHVNLWNLSKRLIFQRGPNGLSKFPHIFQFSYPFVSTLYTIDNRWHYKMILHILLGHIGNDLVETQGNSSLYEATFSSTFFDLSLFFSYYRLTFLSRCLPTSNFLLCVVWANE